MRALDAWPGGLFWTEGEIGVLSMSSLFLTRVGVYVGAGVCIHTHAHTAHMGLSVFSPGVGKIHLEDPNNPNRLDLGICVFVHGKSAILVQNALL